MTLYHIGISGGKDSSALLLWAIHDSGLPREQLRVTFCDTGNEDILTYNHLALLAETVIAPAGIPGGLEHLIPAMDFFELALKKHRFPSRKAQFCTHNLKLEPTRAWIARHAAEAEIVVLNGKRSAESEERRRNMRGQPIRGFSDFWGCDEWAPLADWKLEAVFEIHHRHNVPLNPLYALGARRVGCFPCVNCGKTEIRMVAKYRPEKIEHIARAEQEFESRYGRPSTFFASKTATARYRTKSFTDEGGKVHRVAPIHEIVKWAQTTRGGDQLRLDMEDAPMACFHKHLACE